MPDNVTQRRRVIGRKAQEAHRRSCLKCHEWITLGKDYWPVSKRVAATGKTILIGWLCEKCVPL